MTRKVKLGLLVVALALTLGTVVQWSISWAFLRAAQGMPPSSSEGAATRALCAVIQGVALGTFSCAFWFAWLFGPKDKDVKPLCPKCSYSLEGHAAGICPECGVHWRACGIQAKADV